MGHYDLKHAQPRKEMKTNRKYVSELLFTINNELECIATAVMIKPHVSYVTIEICIR